MVVIFNKEFLIAALIDSKIAAILAEKYFRR